MPGYVNTALAKLQHNPKIYHQYSPHKHILMHWTRKGETQHTTQEDTSPFLHPNNITYIQSVVGTFLYNDRALDSTMLPALNDITSQQAHPIIKTKQKLQHLMDYAHTYPNAFLWYYASDIQLQVDTDAAYLILPKALNCIVGYFHLTKIYLSTKQMEQS